MQAALASSGAAVGPTGGTMTASSGTITETPRRLSVTVHSSASDSATISEKWSGVKGHKCSLTLWRWKTTPRS